MSVPIEITRGNISEQLGNGVGRQLRRKRAAAYVSVDLKHPAVPGSAHAGDVLEPVAAKIGSDGEAVYRPLKACGSEAAVATVRKKLERCMGSAARLDRNDIGYAAGRRVHEQRRRRISRRIAGGCTEPRRPADRRLVPAVAVGLGVWRRSDVVRSVGRIPAARSAAARRDSDKDECQARPPATSRSERLTHRPSIPPKRPQRLRSRLIVRTTFVELLPRDLRNLRSPQSRTGSGSG